MVNWEKFYRRFVWYSQYSDILEKEMNVLLITYWIFWIILKKLSIIGIVVTFIYICGLILIWEICYKLLERLTIPYNLKVYLSFQDKKLARLSIEDPKNGRLFFKLYIFRMVIKNMWKVFFTLPRDVRKGFIVK